MSLGADCNAPNINDESPLHVIFDNRTIAQEVPLLEVFRLLRQNGASVEMVRTLSIISLCLYYQMYGPIVMLLKADCNPQLVLMSRRDWTQSSRHDHAAFIEIYEELTQPRSLQRLCRKR